MARHLIAISLYSVLKLFQHYYIYIYSPTEYALLHYVALKLVPNVPQH